MVSKMGEDQGVLCFSVSGDSRAPQLPSLAVMHVSHVDEETEEAVPSGGCGAFKGTKNAIPITPGLYPSIKLRKYGTRLKSLCLVSLPAKPDRQP